ncbi:hypothetical protein CSC45_6088 [Pseudomonas aeruginosa]|nr:hypothetical protein CSC45_6088 [Pseudomonas aeruginosa]
MDTLHPFFYTRRPGPAAAPRSPVERDTNFPSLHSEGHGDLRCPFFFSPSTNGPQIFLVAEVLCGCAHLWITSASYVLRRHIPSQHPVNPCSRRSSGKK